MNGPTCPCCKQPVPPLEAELNFRISQYEKLVEASNVFCPTSRSPEGCNWKGDSYALYRDLCQMQYKVAGMIGALRRQLSGE